MFKLVIQDDEGKQTVVPLIRDEITIGRKEGNTIRLTERNVSRRHARILRNNGEVHIEDLGSYNGIRVNNARIAERVSLRVSDQVQIGDYKLYLKAEGIEQADDSRTVPIERIDSQLPTEAMATVSPPAPAPHPIHQVPTAPVGPKHALVPGTEPGPAPHTIGPATQAAVAALTAPGGYGKLVVLSSNFAGKEFELSRPQMIIGRTEENDIVINHRSISRNHAKLVREPETGRYTISDLQSSNGVRVNGQDYGKVELRRGDVVDLGHVRLRFVEAGEDFVFARDAVITDVPEAGGRRGFVVAILAAIVVVVAGIVIFMMRDKSDKPKDGNDVVVPRSGSNELPIDAGELVTAVDHPDDGGAIDAAAAPSVVGKPDDDKSQKAGKCTELVTRREWQALDDCATELDALGGKERAAEFHSKAKREMASEIEAKKVQQAMHDRDLKAAHASLAKIGEGSVYYRSLEEALTKAENPVVDEARRRAQGFASAHDCPGLKRYVAQQVSASTDRVIAAVSAIKCTEKAQPTDPVTVRQPAGSGSDSQANPNPPPPVKGICDTMNVEEMMTQAANQYAAGFAKAALSVVVKALNCKQDVRMYRTAAMYACAAHDLAAAKANFNKVPPASQGPIEQKCQQEGLSLRGP
jgi:pSer/pThr/pTyr-binding forkhead associated (FHA) protein